MKKLATIFLAALAVLCLVSCEQEPEVGNSVMADIDGQKYEFGYVYTSFYPGEGLHIVFSTSPNLRDFKHEEGIHFSFEIPVECFNKTLVYSTTQDFDGAEWYFDSDLYDSSYWFDCCAPEEGTTLTLNCEVVANKVHTFQFSYSGTTDSGRTLSISFDGTADTALAGVPYSY